MINLLKNLIIRPRNNHSKIPKINTNNIKDNFINGLPNKIEKHTKIIIIIKIKGIIKIIFNNRRNNGI
jgi:hypothetical protein